jgi:hypothetical protein
MNEIGKTGVSGIQGIGGDLGSVTKTEGAFALGRVDGGLGKSIEEGITGIFDTKVAKFDSKSSSLAALSCIKTELSDGNADKIFGAIRMQLLPDRPGIGLFNSASRG